MHEEVIPFRKMHVYLIKMIYVPEYIYTTQKSKKIAKAF